MSRTLLVLVSACAVSLCCWAAPAFGQQDPPGPHAPQAELAKPSTDNPFGESPAAGAKPSTDDPFAEPAAAQAEPAAEKPARKARPPMPKHSSRPGIALGSQPGKRPLRHGEKEVLKALAEPVAIDVIETSLQDIVAMIKEEHHLAVVIDQKALDDVGIGTDTPITASLSGVSLDSALDLMLRRLGLTWTIQSDVLLITTPEVAESILVTKTYDVGDLLMETPDLPYRGKNLPTTTKDESWQAIPPMQGMGGAGQALPTPAGTSQPLGTMASPSAAGDGRMGFRGVHLPEGAPIDDLIDIITSTVAPTSWDDVGGPGCVAPYQRCLVVSQTLAIHRKVEALLADLRAKRRAVPSLAIELRWLWLDSGQAEALSPAAAHHGRTSLAVDPKMLDMLARQVPGFRGRIACMDGQLVHLASGDRRSAITSAIPVIGSGVGYQPVIEVPNVGVVIEVRPSVSPDDQTALAEVHSAVTRWAKLDPPVTVGGDSPPCEYKEGESETVKAPPSSASCHVDRPTMPAQQWASTVRVPLGKPVLLGGVSFAQSGKAGGVKADGHAKPKAKSKPQSRAPGETPQLYLVLTASVTEP